MIPHPTLSLLCVNDDEALALAPLRAHFESIPHVRLTIANQWPAKLKAYDVVISHGSVLNQGRHPDLENFVHKSGGWLALTDADEPLPALLGINCGPPGPAAELRVLFEKADHLLLGEPITAPLVDRVKVVAILEAAARSMSRGGTLEVLDDG